MSVSVSPSAPEGSPALSSPRPWDRVIERVMDRIPFVEKEMLFLRRLVQPGWTCLDIGAAGGTYLHLLSRLVGSEGQVIGIEPRRRSAALLRRLRRWLAWRNVTIFQVALADSLGSARMVVPRWVRTEAHLAPEQENGHSRGATEIVKQWTLDHLVERARLSRVDLIKCDVEGAEELVFGGADETIRRWKPIVLCEVEDRHLGRYLREPEGLLERFTEHGYTVHRYGGGRLRAVERVDPTENDYVFLPPAPASGPSSV